jgi:hypothetical protein
LRSERIAQAGGARAAAVGLGLAALVTLVIVAFRSTFLTTDAVMALAWGGEIARGELPEVTAPMLPVQHPLPTALGSLLSPLGPDAMIDGYRVVAAASLAVLAYACFRLARRFGGAAAGILAAALVLTRPQIATFAFAAQIDIPFSAMVLLAAALVVEDGVGNRWKALVLLAAAGLLRPEAWPLAAAYAAWLIVWAGAGTRSAIAALAIGAPVLWASLDLVLTGDPFSTVGEARASFSEQLIDAGYEPTPGGPERFDWLPGHDQLEPLLPGLPDVLGWPLAVASVTAAGFVLWRRRAAGPAAGADLRALTWVVAVPLATLVALVLLQPIGLPYSDRFLVLPAAALATVAAAAVALGSSTAIRLVAGVAAVAVLIALPRDLDRVEEARIAGKGGVTNLDDVRTLARQPPVEAASECGPLAAGGHLTVTMGVGVLAVELGRDPAVITIRRTPAPPPASVLVMEPVPGTVDLGSRPLPVLRDGAWAFAPACNEAP